MVKVIRCDNCGRETVEPYRFAGEARDAAWELRRDFVTIDVEHNEDVQHFDACSWSCVAEMAMKRAAEAVTRGADDA